ncbi:uncharacterized protein FA14DRAFT_135138 [Meira miltonrushii]|uniref:Spindle pole body component n=1 Tax=Meira miltonrushii TaxID=1280837 RepID=A0A316VLH7_9BASI|nr:uncharacterized protein FA14DRAFT_135138 [Meira miltonrushii]PWN36395.1 hypothetical protein FA14DRAFT_135138 [Meira miltonrushii]
MSTDGPSSDGRGAIASSSSDIHQTPTSRTGAASNRRKSHKQLSAKQLDKIVKNLTSVQKSVGHLRSDSYGSLSHIGEMSNYENAINDENILLGEDGQRELASYAIEEEDGALLGETTLTGLDLNQLNGAEAWLQRKGLDKSLFKGFSKGPDGIALAKVAAKGPKGKDSAPPDSFLHEATFVFNPLNRRIPHQTPRKQAASGLGAKGLPKLPKESVADRIARTKPDAKRTASGSNETANASVTQQSIGDSTQVEPLASVPKEIQEALVLEDLLFVLSGIEGQYFQYTPSYSPEALGSRLKGATFTIDSGLDQSLQDVVGRILPLATHYTAIFAFVEAESSLEFGTVIHALCAAIRDLLKEYEILIIQLEHQMATSPAFTLQKLWFYVHPTLRTMSLLHNFITEIIEVSHANVLEAEDDGEGDSSDEDDDDEDDEEDSLDRKRRELLSLDDDDENKIVGGIVKGGEVLSLLYDRVIRMGGDEAAHKLFRTLLIRAAQPYADILVRWITTGDLSDTYEEFLVMENPKVTQASLESDPTDEFWERRYTLRDESAIEQKEHERQQGLDLDEMLDESSARGILTGGAKIPAFLEPWKRKILLAGKYLNVIRECSKDVSSIPEIAEHAEALQDADIDMTDESFFQYIETAYQRANTALLSLLLDEHNIVVRLRSMKHYFFQTHSDFFSSFLEAAGRELRKEVVPDKVRDVTIMRLQSHLGMVLGSSNCVGYTDPFREDVKVTLASENAYDQLKRIAEIKGGMEAARAQAKLAKQKDRERIPLMELLQFDLTVKFPTSLVISKKNILRWQFLQRPIINLKATEKALCDVFTEHQEPAWRKLEKGHPQLQKWKMRIFNLRHRILFFVQQVTAFMTAEVIEPNWRDLESKMERATTVDQFLKDHFDFLNLCRKECMLTDLRFVEMMSKLMSVAIIFCDNRVRFRDQLHMERANWQKDLLESPHQIEAPKMSEDVLSFLKRIEGHWEKRLSTFKDIVALLSTTDNPSALPLSYRLQSA